MVDGSAWVSVQPAAHENETDIDRSIENDSGLTTARRYKCPVIGRVAMDMIAIDLTEVPNPTVGCQVTLWGDPNEGAPSVDDIANSAHTLGYELLCRVTQRPIRITI